MKWLVENWSLLVVIACAVVCFIVGFKKFAEQPTEKQIEMLRQWLLYAVIEAEKEFGSGTGALKLRAVYDEFCKTFPDLTDVITFAMFSALVDEALERMRELLSTNKDLECYVED